MKTGIVLAVALTVVTLALGCDSLSGSRSGGTRLYVAQQSMTPDIPVPQGFTMDLNRSYFNSSGGARRGLLTYTGKAQTSDIVTFFRDNMPVSGWVLKKDSADFGSLSLHFVKGAEAADIRIVPGSFNTDVTVSVHGQR